MFNRLVQVREMFLNFFKSKNHTVLKGSSLVPYNDNSLLFTNAGMNQFKDVFLGIKNIEYNNIVTIQSCLRVGGKHNDLKNIGYTSKHNTFFEMMGNFSFNSYFKELAIIYAWELLTSKEWYSISEDNLIVTVHKNDKETYNIWSNVIGLSKENIFLLGNSNKNNIDLNSNNFWRMSEFGPCGYSTEIFFVKNILNKKNICNSNIDNYCLEIWNLVFIEFNIDVNYKITNLCYKSVDTGMGLERICSVLQKKKTNFDIDIFKNMKYIVSVFLDIKINNSNQYIYNIICDHIRSIVFLLLEGILPSNEYRGYILRKIIRRTILHIRLLKIDNFILSCLLDKMYIFFNKNYLINKNKFFNIKNILYNEENKFLKNLNFSLNILNSFILKINKYKNKIKTKIVFLLYDTYGLPIDLIVDVCKYHNIVVNLNKFNILLDSQRERSKKNNLFKKISFNIGNKIKTCFLGYEFNKCIGKILYILKNNLSVNKINFCKKNNDNIIILDKTVLFPESGGQEGDKGILLCNKNNKFIVTNTKLYGDYILHIGYMENGVLEINDVVLVKYNIDNRIKLSCNHSTTHLLKFVLKEVLNTDIVQKGSSIKSSYLNFDFFYNNNLTKENIFNINKLMNIYIWKNLLLEIKYNLRENSSNIKFIFSKNKLSRIIKLGNISEENCCGTHVNNTSEIGFFFIVDNYNISLDIKRIKAVTYLSAIKYLNKQLFLIKNISKFLSVSNNLIISRLSSFFNKNKENKKKINNIKFLYVNDILNNFNIKSSNIFFYKKIRFLIYKIKKLNFLDKKDILFLVFNKLRYKYKLSMLLFIVLNKKIIINYLICIDKKLLNKIGYNNFIKRITSISNKNILILENKILCIYLLKFKNNFLKELFLTKNLVFFIKKKLLNF